MTASPMMTLMTDDEISALGPGHDRGFGAIETAAGRLPLVAMDVDARVSGVLAALEVAQTFVNSTGRPIEATYIFPLPDRAAVHRFRMEVAGRVIDGVVDERAAAREHYEQAIASGQRAAITEEERAGVFTLRVGNLMPGEAATVRLSLVGPLPIDDGEVTFRFPLVVAPRYMPGAQLAGDAAGAGVAPDTQLVPDASRISPPVRLPGCPDPVRLGIRVAFSTRPSDLAASLHAIATGERGHIVELRAGERLDRDFILRWRVAAAELDSALACVDDADGSGGSFMVTLVPPTTTAVAAKPRDLVFVIDRSGSMGGWKMVAARRAAARMVDTLTSRDRFQIIAFDDTAEELAGRGLVAATDRARFAAVEALARVDARGGTELARPLQLALDALAGGYDDRERAVVLVTDGQVGNEDHILREVATRVRNVRVFTLGIDQAVNAAFLRRLAAAGGGLCELVESEDRLDAVMAKVHRRLGTPIATELAIDATGLELDRASIAPARLPDVYAGAPVTIFGRYRGPASASASIAISGTSVGEPLRVTVRRGGDASAGDWLAASWARAHLRDLEDRYATGAHELEPRIVAVSKRHGVLSRFTAYLAIDRSAVANKGGRIEQIVQPVEQPAGWGGALAGAPMRAGGRRLAANMMAMPAPRAAPSSASAMAPPPGAPPQAAAPMAPPPGAPPVITGAAAPSFGPMPRVGAPAPADDFAAANAAPIDVEGAYLARLAVLARELGDHARVGDAGAQRRIRQRLLDWVDDVRSVGRSALADAVAEIVARLVAGGDAAAIADELARIATDGPPPPKKASRLAFWK